MAAAAAAAEDCRPSIYRAARRIKRQDNTLYNALRSIYEDSVFVAEIAGLWPALPLLANLRCGRWYSPRFYGTCYFKSTDGHSNNWDFNTSRLNLHVAQLAGQRGGCIIVDSTRKGKRFPDSMSKTIPVWACVLNRSIEKRIQRISAEMATNEYSNVNVLENFNVNATSNWDTSLHLPVWISDNEKAAIEDHLEEWTKRLVSCGADIDSLVPLLKKPLRPLWISQRTLIWLNEIPDYNLWDFAPVILLSASAADGVSQQRTSSEFSWHYIPGAGDDEESWARGLSPELFWKHVFDLIDCGPNLCNKKVAEIVERERVYRGQRGEISSQVTVKEKFSDDCSASAEKVDICNSVTSFNLRPANSSMSLSSAEDTSFYWIGSTNIATSSSLSVPRDLDDIDCILDCDKEPNTFNLKSQDNYLHLPMLSSKVDRFSVAAKLAAAVHFAKSSLRSGKKLLICCRDGEDVSVCVALAIFTTLFDAKGSFDGGKYFSGSSITKFELRKRLVYICKHAINARPSRGNLRQVFAFISRDKESLERSEPRRF